MMNCIRQSGKPGQVVLLLLIFLSLAGFWNSFDNEFLMDDFPMLVGNLSIGTPDFLQLDSAAQSQVYFRPITHILNLITFSVFGAQAWGYHAVNLVLMIAGGFVFYQLMNRVFAIHGTAFWAVALFIIHPINGVCVNYKNATGNSFLVFAMGLAFLHVFKDAQHSSWNDKILSLIWLTLALLSHEIAFAFPLYLAALLYTSGQFNLKKMIQACYPSGILLTAYFLFRLKFASLAKTVSGQIDAATTSLVGFFSDIGQIVIWYVSKIIFMKDIVLMWNVPNVQGGSLRWMFALVMVITIWGILFFYLRKRNPAAALGLLWFAIGFIPVVFACLSRPWFGIIVQPFWLIMSSLGFFLFGVCVLKDLMLRLDQQFHLVIAIVVLFVILPTTWFYNNIWGNPIRYSEYWMKTSPDNFFPRFWLAYSLMENKEYHKAKNVLEDLISKGLHYEWTFGNLGIAQYHLKNYKESEMALKSALRWNPYRGDTHYYLGLVYSDIKDHQRARKAFAKAVELSPELIDAAHKLEALK